MTPEITQLLQGIQQVIRDSVFTATIISGISAAVISSLFIFINGCLERSAANKRHIQEIDFEQRKLEATMESERRRQAQSLAVQLALEKWKVDHALAVKDRDAGSKGVASNGSDDLGIIRLEVVVQRMVALAETITGKKQAEQKDADNRR